MKRLIYICSAIALLYSCAKMEEIEKPVQDGAIADEEVAASDLPEVIYASAEGGEEDAQTRTYVEGTKVLWHGGDEILYCAGSSYGAKYRFDGEDGSASAEFTKVTDGTEKNQVPFSLGVYPYDEKVNPVCKSPSSYTITPTFANFQEYLPDSFGRGANLMVAAGDNPTDESLSFRNACGYLVIKLYGMNTRVSKIRILANDRNLCLWGKRQLEVYQDGRIEYGDWDNSDTYKYMVTMNCNDVLIGTDRANATEFWFALPPMTIEGGIEVQVDDSYHYPVMTKTTTKDIVINRNEVQPMAALEVNNSAKLTQLWYKKSDMSEPLSWDNAANYFNANIVSHDDAGYKEDINSDPELMYCVTFDRPLTEIRKDAFKGKGITKIVLPDGLTTIGESAFENTGITSVSIPERVTTIGKNAFKGVAITEVDLPEGLTTIGEGAFQGTGLTSVTIPGTMNLIGNNAFSECENLKYVTLLPSSEDEPLAIDGKGGTYSGMEESPFYNTSLQTLALNRKLVAANSKVSMSLFRNHTELSSITIGGQVQTLHGYMFAGTGVTTLDIPANVTNIENSAFHGCEALTSVTISGKVTIGYSAFALCTNLESVNLKGGVNGIGGSAFAGCTKLSSFTMNAEQSSGEIGTSAFSSSTSLTSLTIPGGITSIGDGAFFGCTSLSSISFLAGAQPLTMGFLPGYVAAYRGDYGPFHYCPLTDISLNRNIEMSADYEDACDEEDEGVFSYMNYSEGEHQTTVTVGDNVTAIPRYMFANSGITAISIPANVTSIGNYAFMNCTKLSSVEFVNGDTDLHIGYQPSLLDDLGPFYQSPLTEIKLYRELAYDNDDVRTDEGIFSNKYEYPTKLSLGGSLRTILPCMFYQTGVGAAVGQNGQFSGYAGSVWIPHTITSIGSNAFSNCDKLAGLTLGYDGTIDLPSIGSNVFEGSGSFTYIKVRKKQLQKFKDSDEWNAYEDKLVTSDDFQ